ncbi:hypothetical protein GCM10010387_62410 [Streptomyces inusitatus]|uniref:Uncharacterized protein n=1 Tax=Streptomyces inusitatus TaxID=68221 RepID=A0A918V2P1_9ACTN|nr:hypothetical protein [Streptomyces inusitatus]GGZ60239.1 hypothetical protein GCM10010387_62410 [Streptomyces inusitatus]
MTNEPAIPAQLGRPERMWERAVVLVLIAVTRTARPAFRLTGRELSCSHSNGGWTLTLEPEGKALFYGQDVDCSDTTYRGDKPVDLLATAPHWLPADRLRELNDSYELGYLYWWEEGRWGRAPYPDFVADDGLVASCDGYAGIFDDHYLADSFADAGYRDREAAARFVARVEAGTVNESAVKDLMDSATEPGPLPRESRLPSALEWAARLGVAERIGAART